MASVSVDLRRVLDNTCPIISYTLVARALEQLPASSPKITVSPYELNHVSAAEHLCIRVQYIFVLYEYVYSIETFCIYSYCVSYEYSAFCERFISIIYDSMHTYP